MADTTSVTIKLSTRDATLVSKTLEEYAALGNFEDTRIARRYGRDTSNDLTRLAGAFETLLRTVGCGT